MISCYILSESPSINALKEYIERFPSTKLIGHSMPNAEALNSIDKHAAQILFVDITLAYSQKSILLQAASTSTIVYIANCDSHAYEAFDIMGFDYLKIH